MPASQFVAFSSADAGGPGPITGAAGSLLAMLDACLTVGYGAKATSPLWGKWSIANAGNIGCYQPGAGTQFGIVINDNGPNITSTFKEAWATGWEVVTGVGAPVGTGSGQYPLPAQLLTTGHGVIRKSATADGTPRAWLLFADAYTFYLFINSGDSAGVWMDFMFGDFFALAGVGDAYRSLISMRTTENVTINNTTYGGMLGTVYAINQVVAGTPGKYSPRSWGGVGTSLQMNLLIDTSKSAGTVTTNYIGCDGGVQAPNGPDNSYFLDPVVVVEPGANGVIRGRMRGIYHVCHPSATFVDGQTFNGGGDYAGKTFRIVKLVMGYGVSAASQYIAIETSNTVETN